MTDALAVRSTYLAPPSHDEFDAMIAMAEKLAEAQGFLPAHFYRQPNKILAAILYGRDLGISATNALQHIIVIQGKATADAQLIGMLVRRAGHQMVDVTTDKESTVTITRSDGTVHSATFTLQDAGRAGLLGSDAWKKYPAAMLYARALTTCARKGAQDALMGTVYTPEEVGMEVDGEGSLVPPGMVVDGEILTQDASPESRAALQEAQIPPPNIPRYSQTLEAVLGESPVIAAPAVTVAPSAQQAQGIQTPSQGAPRPASVEPKRRGRPLGSKNHAKVEVGGSEPASGPPSPAFGDEIPPAGVINVVPGDQIPSLRKQLHDLASRLRKYQYLEKGAALPSTLLWEKEVERTLGIFVERKFGTDVALEDVEEAGLLESIDDLKGFIAKYEEGEEPLSPQGPPAIPPPDTTVVQLHRPIVRNAVTAPRRGEPTLLDPKAVLEKIRSKTQAGPDREAVYGELINRWTAMLAVKEGLLSLTQKDEERLRQAATAQIDAKVQSGFGKAVAELTIQELEDMILVAKQLTPKR